MCPLHPIDDDSMHSPANTMTLDDPLNADWGGVHHPGISIPSRGRHHGPILLSMAGHRVCSWVVEPRHLDVTSLGRQLG